MPFPDSISTSLQPGPEGIWVSKAPASPVSYPAEGNEACFAVEDGSFWFRHRNRCIAAVVGAHPPPDRGTLFDIGGGNGVVALSLMRAGFDVALIEPGIDGARHARRRGIANVICATAQEAGLLPGSLPAAGLFDVIEHIEDDVGFLGALRASLRAGGRVYATVPAHAGLWSGEDDAAGHFRRYTTGTLRQAFERAGYAVEFASYFFRVLTVPIALMRALPYRLGFGRRPRGDAQPRVARDHLTGLPLLQRLIGLGLAGEADALSARRALGFGASCILVARNPGPDQARANPASASAP